MSAAPWTRINPAIVRSYDLRGVVGRGLSLDDARALGIVYATAARARNAYRIAVCRDGRLSSPELESALIEGLVAGGMHVHRLGIGPTPQLYFTVSTLGLDGGIMVTGSHNPADQNGFKLLLGREPVYGDALRSLLATPPVAGPTGHVTELSTTREYTKALAAVCGDTRALKVVWDCANGAVAALIRQLTEKLPGTHVRINAEVDGRFPAHHPDPAVPENLRQLQRQVLAEGADVGIAFDGDGDRIGVVDETGTVIWPDQLLLLLAGDVLDEQPGAAIVGDVKSSRVLFDGVAQLGGRPVMAPSGYVIIREVLVREHAPLAGEMSGHIIFADCWNAADDALFVAMRVLRTLARRGRSLASFRRALPATAATPEIRLPCPDDRKEAVIQKVVQRLANSNVQVDRTDGLRVTNETGWWLLRASGTEPKLTVRCEANDAKGLERLRHELMRHLEACGIELTPPAN